MSEPEQEHCYALPAWKIFTSKQSKVFCNFIHIFPLRVHSYMPPDRVFGRIEKTLRKAECIVSPAEYHEIFKDHGQMLRWGIEWKSHDFQTVQTRIYKATSHSTCLNKKCFLTSHIQMKSAHRLCTLRNLCLHPILKKAESFQI